MTAKYPDRRVRHWTVDDYRPSSRSRTVDNLPAHIGSAVVALILIVSPIVFHWASPGTIGTIGTVMVLVGVVVALLTLMLSIKDFHPSRRRRPKYPPGLSAQEKSQIAQLGVAYDRFRVAQDSLPAGPARNRIGWALAGIEPGNIALDVVASSAWSDSWLADHKLHVDPLREATEIYDYLGRVATKVAEFSDRADALHDTPAAATYRQYTEDLTADLSPVQDRVRALFGYRTEINRLSQLLQAEHAQPQLEQDADAVLDLMAESRRHELAAEYLQQRQQELQAITAGLRELQSILNDDSTRLPTGPWHDA